MLKSDNGLAEDLLRTQHVLLGSILQGAQRDRFTRVGAIAMNNHLVIARKNFEFARRDRAAKHPLEPLTYHDFTLNYASALLAMRGTALGVAIQARPEAEHYVLIEGAEKLEEVRLGFFERLGEAFGQSGEGAVAFEAQQCAACAVWLGLVAVEVWPAPPSMWKSHKQFLQAEPL